MSDKVFPDDKGPGAATLGIKDGQIVMNFAEKTAWIALTPDQAVALATGLQSMASSIDGGVERKVTTDELGSYAGMFVSSCGQYLAEKSPVGVAEANEVMGLAVHILVHESHRMAEHTMKRHNKRKKGDADHE
jgi:hypothetical protein